ncbi:energy transducer TonB [Sphingobacterium sp. SRCM116780]|uniref:energy transducer TonB n=1 Tax=Sphingobacterium sp. SRCM116780 TaxID=2907623 RepID=UPI001F230F6F|nr:energy transducer TonB [Sphingobacterium sp. SRCM116780]UIR56806.1 energy transducer TonB [Sphingobacterium sp. SRCM116780]
MIKFKLSVLLIFISLTSFAQVQRLDHNFWLGKINYSIFETHNSSKSVNDTAYYKLYRAGNPKPIAREIKYVVKKNSRDTLKSGYYNTDENSIAFFQIAKNKPVVQRLYTQNSKGLLTLKTSYPTVAPPKSVQLMEAADPEIMDAPSIAASNQVFTQTIDVDAEYPGGLNAFRTYIANNIKYPKEAQENNVSGTIVVKFFVEVDGSVTNILLERKLGYGCDEEVMRVLKKMPKWKPGQLEGKPVRTIFRFPISFSSE